MWKRMFKDKTTCHAWKKADLLYRDKLCVCSEQILTKMTVKFSENTQPAISLSSTPLRQSFQYPSAFRNQATHQVYLNKWLDNHFEYDIPLTFLYRMSLQTFQDSIKPKLLTFTLIKQWEQECIKDAKEKSHQKTDTRHHIQKEEVVYKKVSLEQTLKMKIKL